jgi:hypothetical protein
MAIWRRIRKWYEGTPPDPFVVNSPRFPALLIYKGRGRNRHHWTARAVRAVVTFSSQHWQWLLSTAVAVATVYVAVLALK